MSKSQIFFYFCSCFIGGIIFASLFNVRFLFAEIYILSIAAFILFIFLFLLLKYQKFLKIFGFGLICFLIFSGAIFYYYQRFDFGFNQNTIQVFNDKGKIYVLGQILENPERDLKQTKFVLEAKEIKSASINEKQKVIGRILITTTLYPILAYGDEVEMYGLLKTPENFNDFNYKDYLASKDIYSVSYHPQITVVAKNKGNPALSALFFIKNKFEESINFIIPEPEGSLLSGLILGSRSTIGQNILDNFNSTGLTHIIALSGFNITIIIFSLFAIFNFFGIGRNISFWFAIVIIVFFTLMTGASASVVRAAVMGVLVLVASRSSRVYLIKNAIIFTGVLMLILDPRVLKYDIGFQLSFLATLGLIYLAPILKEKIFYFMPDFLSLKEIISSTISAQLLVFPILIYNFGRISIITPITNILVLPTIPTAMALGFFSGVIGFLKLSFLKFLILPAYLFLAYIIKIAEVFAQIPFASLDIGKISPMIFYSVFGLYYLFIIRFYLKNKHEERSFKL